MKKLFGGIALIALLFALHGSALAATSAAASQNATSGTGLQLLQQLQSGAISCADLSQQDLDAMGDYFMEQMMGSYHNSMDAVLRQRLGDAGDTAMHVAMGERFSGCNIAAALPLSGNEGFYPMVQMMGGYDGTPATNGYGMMGTTYAPVDNGYSQGMMGGWEYGRSWLSWIWIVLWYIVTILLIVLGIRWLRKSHLIGGHRSSLDILKERYAKGELSKEHFEEMRKEILK